MPEVPAELSPRTDRLVGLVVKASASREADLGSIPAFAMDVFPRSSHASDLLIGTPVAALAGQAPGTVGSALGLVGPVSVLCDWVR